MGAPKDYTEEEILLAIKGSAGIYTTIGNNLGCCSFTAKKYVEKYEETQIAYNCEKERILDLAESELIKHIEKGDQQMIKYYLSKIGKHRGYGDTIDIDMKSVNIVYLDKDDKEL